MDQIDQILAEVVCKGETPSIQYYFFDNVDILKESRFGMADIGNKIRVAPDTSYHAFSVTKTFTALAVLMLAEEGKLTIEDPVKKYLPDFTYGDAVTIRQLLSHAGGIPNPIPISWIHLENEHAQFDEKAFFKRIIARNTQVKYAPNKKFAYSNIGYVILGELVERLSGKSYKEFVNENIIHKLGLTSRELGFEITSDMALAKGYQKSLSLANFIIGFLIKKKKFMKDAEDGWKPFNNFYVNGPSYGGLIGKPYAFVKYIQALLPKNNTLLSTQYIKMLFEENRLSNNKASGMCLSWFKGQLNGSDYFTHAGGGGGYYCELRIYPLQNRGSIVFFNRSGMADYRFLDTVDRYLI